jgi:hypothetical protein
MKPTCRLHTWRPHQRRPLALVLHLHQHQSRCNLHLQYLAKNQSTQRCQSLITQGSDHPPVLDPHMVLNALTATSKIPRQTSCLSMHPQTKPATTRTPDVSATGSGTDGVDVSVRASPYGTSHRHLTKSKDGCILPLNNASCLSLSVF